MNVFCGVSFSCCVAVMCMLALRPKSYEWLLSCLFIVHWNASPQASCCCLFVCLFFNLLSSFQMVHILLCLCESRKTLCFTHSVACCILLHLWPCNPCIHFSMFKTAFKLTILSVIQILTLSLLLSFLVFSVHRPCHLCSREAAVPVDRARQPQQASDWGCTWQCHQSTRAAAEILRQGKLHCSL